MMWSRQLGAVVDFHFNGVIADWEHFFVTRQIYLFLYLTGGFVVTFHLNIDIIHLVRHPEILHLYRYEGARG